MKTKYANLIIILLIVLSIAIGIYFYPLMPAKMVSHWNGQGIADGYSNRFWGLFLLPIVLIFCFVLFRILPKIDPYKKNVQDFIGYYNIFMVIFSLFMFYVFMLSIMFNIYTDMHNMLVYFAPAFGILFYYCGILIQKAKRNWFIGIKTPWTLSSDYVWDKTHKLGGYLFKISAILSLVGVFFEKIAIWFVLVPVIISAITVIVYSYIVYKQKEKADTKKEKGKKKK